MKGLIGLLLLLAQPILAAEGCSGPYQGKQLTQAQLDTILASPKPYNLCGSRLSHLNFRGADLSHSNLSETDLSYSNLQNANLSYTKMHKAFMRWANVQKINFRQAELQSADFQNANATQANFLGTNLSGASFINTQLNDADFSFANLTASKLLNATIDNINLYKADISQALFEPKHLSIPDLISLSTVTGFRELQFSDFTSGTAILIELRNRYKKLGLRSMERQITALVKVKQMQQAWQHGGWSRVEATLSYVGFYLTVDYGAAPGRPLRLFLIGLLLFSIPYGYVISKPNGRTHLFVIWPRKQKENLHLLPQNKTYLSYVIEMKSLKLKAVIRMIRLAFYFSLLSAFHLGWRELNVGNWISSMQKRPYRIRANGWVRALAGVQALLSAFLVVLWAFAYFGRPFEW